MHWGMQFKATDPCFRDDSPISILSSSVLGLVHGFCGTGDNLVALYWSFLGVGLRALLLGLCSWSQLLPHQPCRNATDARWCAAGQGSPCQEECPWAEIPNLSGWTQNLFLPFPICWGHQDMQSGLISGLNTLDMQLTGILWRTVLILSLLKTSLSHWTQFLAAPLAATSSYLLLRNTKSKEEAILWSCRVLGEPWGKGLICYVCAHLSSFVPEELPHDGDVEASIVLSQKLGLAAGNQGPLLQTSCRGHDSKLTVLPICSLKSCVRVYTYICADRKHLCLMVCNSSF